MWARALRQQRQAAFEKCRVWWVLGPLAQRKRGDRGAGRGWGQVFWTQCTHLHALYPAGPAESWKYIKQGKNTVRFVFRKLEMNGLEIRLELRGSVWGLSVGCRQALLGVWIRIIFGHLMQSWLIGKDSDAGRDWGQEEKGTTEDEMAGWQHRLDGRESEWTSGVGDGQGGLACCDSWGRKESDMTERLNWTELNWDKEGEKCVQCNESPVEMSLFSCCLACSGETLLPWSRNSPGTATHCTLYFNVLKKWTWCPIYFLH